MSGGRGPRRTRPRTSRPRTSRPRTCGGQVIWTWPRSASRRWSRSRTRTGGGNRRWPGTLSGGRYTRRRAGRHLRGARPRSGVRRRRSRSERRWWITRTRTRGGGEGVRRQAGIAAANRSGRRSFPRGRDAACATVGDFRAVGGFRDVRTASLRPVALGFGPATLISSAGRLCLGCPGVSDLGVGSAVVGAHLFKLPSSSCNAVQPPRAIVVAVAHRPGYRASGGGGCGLGGAEFLDTWHRRRHRWDLGP